MKTISFTGLTVTGKCIDPRKGLGTFRLSVVPTAIFVVL